jgi:hypothetical protein
LLLPCSQTPFSYNGATAGNVHSGYFLSLTDAPVDSYDSDNFPNSISAYQELVTAIKAAQAAVGATVPIVLTGHSLVSCLMLRSRCLAVKPACHN